MYSNTDALRRQQVEDGRAMARTDGTLHRKPQPKLIPKQKRESKLEGHEKFLAELAKAHCLIYVRFIDGSEIEGEVRHADKYTITLRHETVHGSRDVVYFKSAIAGFYPIDFRKKTDDETVH